VPGADPILLSETPVVPQQANDKPALKDAIKITFASSQRDFHDDVKARVKAHFAERGESQYANAWMVFKMFFWVGLPVTAYALAMFGQLGRLPSLALWCVGGFGLAGIGFNVGHDAIHGAFSKNKRLNRLVSLSFDVMGASSDTWALAHNFLHHTYANIKGGDTDIEPGPYIRLYPRPDDVWLLHRFQHIYAWFLYSFAGFNWVWSKDWIQMFSVDPRTGKPCPNRVKAKIVLGKASHITLFLVLPLLFSPFAWWEVGIGYAAAGMVTGFTLAIVFQMAHVVKECEFPLPDDSQRMDVGWAENQMRTTANFDDGNRVINFITGGLDHQIEHHLFPKICHVHYPAIAPMVKQCAQEHGLPYLENKTFTQAMRSHHKVLWECGRPEEAARLLEEQVARQAARLAA